MKEEPVSHCSNIFRGDVNGNIDNIKNLQNRMGSQHDKEMRETKSMVHKVRR